MTAHYDCDCPDCLMEQIPQPTPGFSPAVLRELWEPDPYVERICQGCSEKGDCVYAGDRSARTMCRVVKKAGA